MMNEFTYIYALYDPRGGNIRYIGKSDNPYNRLKYCHIRKQELNADTHKSRWIKQLISINLKPTLKIIEKVNKNDWCNKEKYWIKYYKNKGVKLTNETNGGEGREVGFKHKKSSVQKIINALTGRFVSEETRNKIREKNKKNYYCLTNEQRIINSKYMKDKWNKMTDLEKNKALRTMKNGFTKDRNKKISKAVRKRPKAKNCTSEYYGVSYIDYGKRKKRWRAYYFTNKKQIIIGYFNDEIEAALAYNLEARKLFGEFAKLNEI